MDERLSEAKTSRGGLVTLRTVLRTRLLFSFYSGIDQSVALRVIARIYCLCLPCGLIYVLFSTITEFTFSIRLVIPTVQCLKYIINFVISFHAGDSFINFCVSLAKVDTELGFDHLLLMTPSVKNVFFLLCFVSVLCPVILLTQITQLLQSLAFLSATIMTTAVDFNGLLNLLSLDLVRYRLFVLRHVFKINLKRDNGSRNNINYKTKIITNSLKLYSTLIDNMDIMFPWAKLEIFINLIGAFLVFLASSLHNILSFKNDGIQVLTAIVDVLRCSMFFLLACLPCVFAELATREVEEFKTAIGNELLVCEDEETCDALMLAGDYLELRPFRVTFCRVFTLDASLSLAYASLCTTTLIVIIQLSGII